MAASTCTDNLPAHSTGFAEPDTLQADLPAPLSVYVRISLDVEDHRKKDISSRGIDWQDRHQSDEEVKKDLISEVILLTYSRPFLGRSPLSFLEIFEGAPCPTITYLAHFTMSLHHLLYVGSAISVIILLGWG